MTKFILVTFILFSFISLADINSAHIPSAQSIAASAQPTDTNNADLELAQRYVPVLYFHPDEISYPQPVDVVLGISRLRQSRLMWFDTTIQNHSTMQDLFTKPSDETWFLDQWLGDTGSSEYANYSTHSLHNLLANSLVGLNVFTVIVTSAGTLVLWAVAGWSLLKQRRLLRKELHGFVHDSLYYSVQDPLVRAKAQWNALQWEGFRAWIQVRRLQGLCIKLANARLQARLFPENHNQSDKASALQAEINSVLDGIHPLTR